MVDVLRKRIAVPTGTRAMVGEKLHVSMRMTDVPSPSV
jgi:hypothetical protein